MSGKQVEGKVMVHSSFRGGAQIVALPFSFWPLLLLRGGSGKFLLSVTLGFCFLSPTIRAVAPFPGWLWGGLEQTNAFRFGGDNAPYHSWHWLGTLPFPTYLPSNSKIPILSSSIKCIDHPVILLCISVCVCVWGYRGSLQIFCGLWLILPYISYCHRMPRGHCLALPHAGIIGEV